MEVIIEIVVKQQYILELKKQEEEDESLQVENIRLLQGTVVSLCNILQKLVSIYDPNYKKRIIHFWILMQGLPKFEMQPKFFSELMNYSYESNLYQ